MEQLIKFWSQIYQVYRSIRRENLLKVHKVCNKCERVSCFPWRRVFSSVLHILKKTLKVAGWNHRLEEGKTAKHFPLQSCCRSDCVAARRVTRPRFHTVCRSFIVSASNPPADETLRSVGWAQWGGKRRNARLYAPAALDRATSVFPSYRLLLLGPAEPGTRYRSQFWSSRTGTGSLSLH